MVGPIFFGFSEFPNLFFDSQIFLKLIILLKFKNVRKFANFQIFVVGPEIVSEFFIFQIFVFFQVLEHLKLFQNSNFLLKIS